LHRWLPTLWLVLAFALVQTGCTREPAPPSEDAGPQRIICMAPNIAEAVFALGAGERVVGVSDYTSYPAEAKAKPTVGALYNPDLERIVTLKPDLVIVQKRHEKVEALCRGKGIALLTVNMEERAETILEAIRILGDRLGCAGRATTLRGEIEAELAAVRRRVEGRPRVKALICVDRSAGSLKGIYCASNASFLTELLAIAGGENVFADERGDYVQASLEGIVRRAPEVIIETNPRTDLSDEARRRITAEWRALETLPAVKENRIYLLTDDFMVLPGPRIGKAAARLAEVLHPEAQDAH